MSLSRTQNEAQGPRGFALTILCIVLALVGLLLQGCTTFKVTFPGGPEVESTGAVLLSRNDSFVAEHEWLDEKTNTLHKVSVRRVTDENASAQLEALRYAFDAGKAAAGPSKGLVP